MSKFRGVPPSPNPLSNIIAPSVQSKATSHPPPHGHSPPFIPLSEGRLQPYTSRHASFLSSSTQNHPTRDSTMARRFHGQSPQMRGRHIVHSSPSSDSQDDLADTETDNKGSQTSGPPAPSSPAKKKRTRTLTTPHQSAVLYALLAESRFPSTAVREEVGRSIGLSARKVQIWFQNQRQKARRPQSQTDPSRKRPQGSPTSGLSISSNGTYVFPDPGPSAPPTESSVGAALDQPGHRGYHSDSPAQLAGPGMPGSDPHMSSRYNGRPILPLVSELTVARPSSSPYMGSSQRYPEICRSPSLESPASRPTTTSRLHDLYFSRTLPPLINTVHNRPPPPVLYPPGSGSRLPPLQRQPVSPDTPFSHHSPDADSLTLPPPYTLQPPPHWRAQRDTSGFGSPKPYSRTPTESRPPSRSFSPLSRRSTDFPASTTTREGGPRERSTSAAEAPLPPRVGRYDPVRAAFIVTTPTESQ